MKLFAATPPTPYLDLIEPGLLEAMEHAYGEAEVSDVAKSLFAGQALLWIALDDEDRYCGFVVSERLGGRLPRLNLAYMWCPNGLDDFLAGCWPVLEEHAKSMGCKVVEFTSRRAWDRIAEKTAFEPAYRVYRRPL